jgi:hypothetical protein
VIDKNPIKIFFDIEFVHISIGPFDPNDDLPQKIFINTECHNARHIRE